MEYLRINKLKADHLDILVPKNPSCMAGDAIESIMGLPFMKHGNRIEVIANNLNGKIEISFQDIGKAF